MKKPTSIYLVFGEDGFLVEQGLGRLLAHLKSEAGEDLAIDMVDCKEAGPAGAIEEVLAPSLFSVNKVTVLKYFQLTGQSKMARELEAFVSTGLAPGQFLVLVPDKVDKRLRIVKAIDKAGGLSEALSMRRRAHEMGFSVMVGCMVSTSLAMAPAVLLAQEAEFIDLDGPLILAKDRPHGLAYSTSIVSPPSRLLWG